MIVIPAIDIIDGSVVRLTAGDYSRVYDYSITPVEAAKRFEDGGLEHLHVVDLDGAEGKGRRNLKTLEKIAAAVSMKIDFGGGVRSADDAAAAFSSGAYAVNIGSMAVKNPEETRKLGEKYPGRIIISADVRGDSVAISGWKEDSGLCVIDFLSRCISDGIAFAAVTDISRDGMMSGPSSGLYRKLIDKLPSLKLIASGGVRDKADLLNLSELGVYGAIVGKAYYEGFLTIKEMKEAECSRVG